MIESDSDEFSADSPEHSDNEKPKDAKAENPEKNNADSLQFASISFGIYRDLFTMIKILKDGMAAQVHLYNYLQIRGRAKLDINYRFYCEKDSTLLMLAATYGFFDLAQQFITLGADVTAINTEGLTAFDLAIKHKHYTIAKLLPGWSQVKLPDFQLQTSPVTALAPDKLQESCENKKRKNPPLPLKTTKDIRDFVKPKDKVPLAIVISDEEEAPKLRRC